MLKNDNKQHMTKVTYQTHGTCSKFINISIDDEGNVEEVQFIGGCDGNTKGICSLVQGMKAAEVKKRLRGIRCGNKLTSCPDQLATALEQMGWQPSTTFIFSQLGKNSYLTRREILPSQVAKNPQ